MKIHGCFADHEQGESWGLGADPAAPFHTNRVVDEVRIELAADHQHRAGLGGPAGGFALSFVIDGGLHLGMPVREYRKHAIGQQRKIASAGTAMSKVERHQRLPVFHVQAQRTGFPIVDAGIGGEQQPFTVQGRPVLEAFDVAIRLVGIRIQPMQAQGMALQVDVDEPKVLSLERQILAIYRMAMTMAAA
ncbi:hypothetical protein RF55_20560 [Lasius niger]|uniref:Uncharacterized protein n=1 Tax=Lasius niger TaxID=67767 RepID=A0A0J7JYW4_LASNI|nr:hypothetical protein RF55_20560 [Lasius niger]